MRFNFAYESYGAFMKKILFMGTPEISSICLQKLLDGGFSVVGVVTREDKPRGRGKQMMPTPTKALALEYGIPVYEPKTLRDESFMEILRTLSPDLIVVVAYGKILPPAVLDFAPFGAINLHVSLLPKYRGAAPMQRAIMEGERETGVTVMYMAEGLDTGDIITQSVFPIGPLDDFEAIHDRSAEVGGALLCETIPKIFDGTATRTPQCEALATYAAKIEKGDCHIDFEESASVLDPMIRGVTPIPGAYAYHNGAMLKIRRATPITAVGKPGEVLEINGVGTGSFTVACGEGALLVTEVIPEGKGRMSAGDFVRGRKIQKGDVLS